MACNVFPEVEVEVGFKGEIYRSIAEDDSNVTIQISVDPGVKAVLTREGPNAGGGFGSIEDGVTTTITGKASWSNTGIVLEVTATKGVTTGKCRYVIGVSNPIVVRSKE